ncbi:hypothetical protein JL721_5747 [Aureococcus anophagefferens]|nr:hypothetical protein JL721_5747 [Aureococcus anophagefferens]
MNDDQSDIRRSVSMSHGLLMASSPEQKGNQDLPGAFYGDDDEDLGATRRNASHSLDAATSSIDPNSSLDLPKPSLRPGRQPRRLSPMTTEASASICRPSPKDDRAAAAKPPRSRRRGSASGKVAGAGPKAAAAKGDGDRTGRYAVPAAAARSR